MLAVARHLGTIVGGSFRVERPARHRGRQVVESRSFQMDGSRIPGSAGGNTLGKYRLIAELGSGGMADVYLAVVHGPAGFNKLVVLKQIRTQLAEDPEFLGMFLDEARLAARLSHPNVVQTNEVGHDGRRYFMAMEYLDGQPLNRVLHRLGRTGGLPLGLHLRVLSETLAGLHHAHELRDYDGTPLEVVHRDMSPHNVFVTYDGQVKIVDFGIAKAMNSSSETRAGVIKGKVAYMAPEQVRGDRVDRRADVFSVGVMLWEAAAGRRLWKGLTDVAVLARVTANDVPQLRSVKPDVPRELEEIVTRAMAHRREDRYPSAAALQAALETLLERFGGRTAVRDLGPMISAQFEEDRAKIRSIIEMQLRSAKSLPTAEWQAVSLPQLDAAPAYLGHTPASTDPSYSPSIPSPMFGPRPSVSAPSTPQPSTLTASTSSTGSSLVGPPPVASAARPIVVMVAALFVGAIGAFLWLQARPASSAGVSPAIDKTSAVAAVAASPSVSATSTIDVPPPAATSAATPVSSASSAVVVAAPSQPVVAAPVHVQPTRVDPPPPPAPPTAEPTKTEPGDDRSRAKSKRPIDSANPYAQ